LPSNSRFQNRVAAPRERGGSDFPLGAVISTRTFRDSGCSHRQNALGVILSPVPGRLLVATVVVSFYCARA
jgi:hypothetical protein